MNNKIIFMHIPKCGGTTFNSILDRIYNPNEIYTIKNIDKKDFISLSTEEKNNIKVLKGGHCRFGLHEYFSTKTEYITFLRDPVERIISNYYYVKRTPSHRFHDLVSTGISLYDYVIEIEKEGKINNGQIRCVSGINDKVELMLEKSLDNIAKYFSFVGLVEKYDESLVILQKLYRWPTPYYDIRNKTKNRPVRSNIDPKTIDLIKKLNSGDIILYNEMSNVLNQRLKNENSINRELLKFSIKSTIYRNKNRLWSKANRILPTIFKNALKRILC